MTRAAHDSRHGTFGGHRRGRALALTLLAGALLSLEPSLRAEDWPQLLGPGRDGVSNEAPPAPWGKEGPPVAWKVKVGQGWSAPAVASGRLVLFHRVGRHETVEGLDADTGEKLWSSQYSTSYRDDFGFDEGPRATPTIAGGRVFTLGAQGVLTALSLDSGEVLWQVRTHEELGVRKGFFGAAGSPLVEQNRVFLNVGGSNGKGLVAFDAATGKRLWSNGDDEASYSSPVAATLGGKAAIVFFTRAGLVVTDPADGRIRFRYPWRARMRASVNAATPLVVGERIFLSASYQTGAVLLETHASTSPAGTLTEVWASDEALSNHYATSVHHRGVLYGFHGRQEYGPSLRAVELATGKVLWSRDRFGAGTVLRARDHLLVLREDGTLFLAEATPRGFEPKAEAKVLAPVVRAYPAYADGRLYARNAKQLVCLKLQAESGQ